MSGYQNYNNYYPGYPGDYYNSYNQYPAGKYRLVWEDVYKGLRVGGKGGGQRACECSTVICFIDLPRSLMV